MIRVEATLDRKRNRIEVRARNVSELTFFLHDRMLDLDKEIEIRVNRKTVFKGKVSRSIETLIESARTDRGLLYTAQKTVRVK